MSPALEGLTGEERDIQILRYVDNPLVGLPFLLTSEDRRRLERAGFLTKYRSFHRSRIHWVLTPAGRALLSGGDNGTR